MAPDLPRVVGHRGAAGHAPENTLASFRKAAELRVSWVEFDVKLSRDGVPVVCHDETLERTTDGSGRVADTDLAVLKTFDAGSWFGPAFRGETIPTLAETVALLVTLGLGANVEIKPSPGAAEATARAVGEELGSGWPARLPPPLLSSFDSRALLAAAESAPDVPRAWLVKAVPADWRDRLEELGCGALHCDCRRLTADGVAAVRGAGYEVRSYTVNRAAAARRLFGWGVGAVFSDYPDRLLRALA